MKTRPISETIRVALPVCGLGLLALIFIFSAWRVGRFEADERDGRVVIRIAHWQLEAGIRQGIDAAARAYEARHPNVRIEQILVPERVYPIWLTTRLVGDMAPEIIELPPNYDSARVARFFRPFGTEIDLPNVYNEGTALEGMLWRNTFIDGLASGYHEELSDYYGVGPFTGSRALYYNRSLLRALTGSDEPLKDYAALEEMLGNLKELSERRGNTIMGFAMHRTSATTLFNDLFAAQFQELGAELSRGTGLPVAR